MLKVIFNWYNCGHLGSSNPIPASSNPMFRFPTLTKSNTICVDFWNDARQHLRQLGWLKQWSTSISGNVYHCHRLDVFLSTLSLMKPLQPLSWDHLARLVESLCVNYHPEKKQKWVTRNEYIQNWMKDRRVVVKTLLTLSNLLVTGYVSGVKVSRTRNYQADYNITLRCSCETAP